MRPRFRRGLSLFWVAGRRSRVAGVALQTRSSRLCGVAGSSTAIASPGFTTPPASTIAITPDLRTRFPPSSRSSTAFIRPGRKPSSCLQGLRRPVISTTASSPSRRRAPVGSASRSTPRVVTFSPMSPGETSKPAAFSSSCSSAWIRCTWRRFGCVGSRATRERCFTVAPACASPSTPSPSSSRTTARVRLLNSCDGVAATATTSALLDMLLREDRPALVIAPLAVDLQVARREALEPEARALRQRDRALVAGLDVRLEPVQPERAERVAEHELDAFRHVALAGEGPPDGIAEVGIQERPAEDLAEVEEPEDAAVAAPAQQEQLEVVGACALDQREELLVARRRERPRPVVLAALAHELGELVRVAGTAPPDECALARLEGAALCPVAKSHHHVSYRPPSRWGGNVTCDKTPRRVLPAPLPSCPRGSLRAARACPRACELSPRASRRPPRDAPRFPTWRDRNSSRSASPGNRRSSASSGAPFSSALFYPRGGRAVNG